MTLQRFIEAKVPYRLVGSIQSYSWGKVGIESRIAAFPGAQGVHGPLAEYWLGAHPRGPALVLLPSGESLPLPTLLAQEAELSFMLKVLSINSEFGLSIQSHPDSFLARQLHHKDPTHYPDTSHKPELGVALTSTKLAYGFKTFSEIQDRLRLIPELKQCMGNDLAERMLGEVPQEQHSELRQRGFSVLMRAEPDQVSSIIRAIMPGHVQSYEELPEVADITKLVTRHGEEDVGLLALLFLNIITLEPGQAVFIGPNVPHAYLDGDLVECMACSDNVIRAGLTNKFKDVERLLSSLDYSSQGVPIVGARRDSSSGVSVFDAPVSEFTLALVRERAARLQMDTRMGIALCIGEAAVITNTESQASLALRDGEAALLLAGSGSYECVAKNSQVFVAFGETRRP